MEASQEQPVSLLATVIILSFHRAAALRRCLEAVEKSAGRPRLQVIVLDCGNHDTNTDWDHSFPETTFLRMPRHFGSSKAWNIGLRSARAEFVLFLDPAIVVQPDTVARLVEKLEALPAAAAVCPVRVDSTGTAVPQIRSLPGRSILWNAWQDPSAISAAPLSSASEPVANEYPGNRALLTRLTFLKGMNYFDERYGDWGGDLELAFQIRHAGKKALVLPEVPVTDHGSSDSGVSWSEGQQATFAADRLSGVAHFLGKRAGFVSEMVLRLQAIAVTLVRALTFQRPAYNWSLLTSLLGGQKIDGSQGSV